MAPRRTEEEEQYSSSEQQEEEDQRTMQSVSSFHKIAACDDDVSDAHRQILLKSANKCSSYKTGAAGQGTFRSADETYGNCCGSPDNTRRS